MNENKSASLLKKVRIVLWILVLVGIGVMFFNGMMPLKKPVENEVSVTDPSLGEIIGGSFTLVNQNGETVTEATFKDKYMLIYFGFASCPDICPTDLVRMGEILEKMGDKADNIATVFVSIDPARDSVEVLKKYSKNFDKRITLLTGTEQQVAAAAKAYRVYYQKVENQSSPENYMMDHSSFMYLMGKDGKYLAHFSHAESADEVVKKIERII
jgi:protein SCO1/2